jgi:NAD-dependent dihydropyrimidine dehydrogenase PreA subunit
MAELIYLRDVVTLRFADEKCIGCGMCITVCPRGVFHEDGEKVRVGDRDHCIECGACALNCPADAVEVKRGVGCAAAVINSMLGRSGPDCCCLDESDQCDRGGTATGQKNRSSCC